MDVGQPPTGSEAALPGQVENATAPMNEVMSSYVFLDTREHNGTTTQGRNRVMAQ